VTNPENVSTQSDSLSAISFRTSWFDCVSSFLLALMIFISSFVAVLLMLWLFSPSDELVSQLPPVSTATVGQQNAWGMNQEFELPDKAESIEGARVSRVNRRFD
jgi:ABC-type dipeptide/oligopeptide/nickel transport system permease component